MGSDLNQNPPRIVQRVLVDNKLLLLQQRYDYALDGWRTVDSVPDTLGARTAFAALNIPVELPTSPPLIDRLKLGAKQPDALATIDAWLREQPDLSTALRNLYGTA